MSDLVVFRNVFDAAQIARIERAAAPTQTAAVERAPAEHRSCEVSWIDRRGELAPVFARLIEDVNAHFFRFDLEPVLTEDLQYTVYGEGGHYGWHMDKGEGALGTRKLSVTVQLSDGHEYQGGDFEAQTGSETVTGPRELGSVLAFPSWLLHRVTPVTRGVRRSLVVWAHGEAPFR